MSKNLYRMIVGITGGVAAVAAAIVTYCKPEYASAINASIAVAETAIAEICSFFTEEK